MEDVSRMRSPFQKDPGVKFGEAFLERVVLFYARDIEKGTRVLPVEVQKRVEKTVF